MLDRTKEPGSVGEPLYQDVVTALFEQGMLGGLTVVGGRYGLGSKDTPPSSVFAVYRELAKDAPAREFTIGIVDDVTHLSLPEDADCPNTAAPGTIECKFWGLGGDGTVGANKNSIKIIGDHTDKYVQAYFQYDSKKTGGVTISHLRFGDAPIRSPYYINKADFVACHNPSYVTKGFRMVQDVKPGGIFLVNCQWTPEELGHHLDAASKRYIAAERHAALHHQRHRSGARGGHGQAHQHHPAVGVLRACRRAAARRGYRLHEGRGHQELPQEGPGRRRHATTAPSTRAPRRSPRSRFRPSGRAPRTRPSSASSRGAARS